MTRSPPTVASREIALEDLAATQRFAAVIADRLVPGDVVGLAGELGAGKTAVARAMIAARGGGEEVPSPTFTLVQTYPLDGNTLWHFDLYRLAKPDDAIELAIEDAFAGGISLIEWPVRLGDLMPPDWLEVELLPGPTPDARRAHLTGHGRWADRLDAMLDGYAALT